MSSLALSNLFEYVCYGSTTIKNIFTSTVQIDFSRQNLTSTVGPRTVRVNMHLSFILNLGPNHPWLVNLYSNHVPHPSAAVVGQELFASGIIPSDTDYRIYRDFGGLPGLYGSYIIYLSEKGKDLRIAFRLCVPMSLRLCT